MGPLWLTEGNEPAAFRKIWEQVGTPTGLTDTPTLSCILLGSGLGTDTLGYIWSLTNTTVSGALTKVELYRNLALIALAQKGYSFSNLLVLNQFSEAPIPRLDLRPSIQLMPNSTTNSTTAPTAGASLVSVQSSPVQVPTVTETLSLLDTLTEPLVPAPVNCTAAQSSSSFSILSATDLNKLSVTSEPTPSSSSNVDDDEFDDFKSADIFSTDSLTVLEVKDSSSTLTEAVITEDLFKTNIPSFTFHTDKRNALDDIISATVETDHDKKANSDNQTISNSNVEGGNTVAVSSLQEALREDLTLAPVNLPSMMPTVPTSSPVDSDRYNALRQLAASNNASPQEDFYDDFGDFITASQPSGDTQATSLAAPTSGHASSLFQSDLQEKCLEACVQVLREANDLFKSIDDTKVLAEVIDDDRGKRYLEEIVEVERIGRRIISSKSVQTDDCELSKQLESLCKALEPFTKPLEHTHLEEEKGAVCGLCQCEQGPAHVKYGINQYHAPCANLFLHVTGELLPLTPVT
uniref:EH domain-containing protein n=2 Tax=Rhodnius prolixus TaxID=13249 RepID=T1HQW8_RHOPR